MFDNPRKELEELQEKLLQDEDWFEKELDSAKRMIGQQPDKDRLAAAEQKKVPREVPVREVSGGVSLDATQVWRRELSLEEDAPQAEDKSIKKLLILAAAEILGIAAIGAYWALLLL
jgi:parvulin-like peptidyl-prolyl isomerase